MVDARREGGNHRGVSFVRFLFTVSIVELEVSGS